MKLLKKVTQNDVARCAGVSRSMVSYVLNGSDHTVAPETREKIVRAIDDLGYRPNKFAQALLRGSGANLAYRQIGIILCHESVFLRPYYAEILSGIYSAAHEHAFHIRFIRFFNELRDPVLFNQLIHQEEIYGLLLVATDQCITTTADRQIIEHISRQIERIVCVDWQTEGISSIMFDRHDSARKAVRYLFGKGYGDIVYIGENDERVGGFRQAFIERNAPDGDFNAGTLSISDAMDMSSGYQAIQKLHQVRGSLPRAITAGSDEVAIGIMRYLHEQGIKIPEQTAIISIDGIESAEYTNPPLTTVYVPKHAMGQRAVDMIVTDTAFRGENALSILLQTHIIERASAS